MSPRGRIEQNRDLPPNLYRQRSKAPGQPERFCYRFPDGRRLTRFRSKRHAIETAKELNAQLQRGQFAPLVPLEVKRVKDYREKVEQVFAAERLEPSTRRPIIKEMDRFFEFFGQHKASECKRPEVVRYLDELQTTSTQKNKALSRLDRFFNYLVDLGFIEINPAKGKKRLIDEPKKRQRLELPQLLEILEAAPQHLQIAIRLALQTGHSVNEIASARYDSIQWYDAPVIEDGIEVFGEMMIERKKVRRSSSGRVLIPVGAELKRIVEDSRDRLICPYIVHKYRSGPAPDWLDHPFAMNPVRLSRDFSQVRDRLGLFADLPPLERPTFHEIRSLSARLLKAAGIDPQVRLAHASAKMTELYLDDGKPKRATAAEIKISADR